LIPKGKRSEREKIQLSIFVEKKEPTNGQAEKSGFL
jgi:hypothetical protein